MSHAPADPHDADNGEHDAHEAVEPPDELAPDEPKTPLWLTAVGGGLFLLLAIVWLAALGRSSESEAMPAASATASVAVAAPPPPPPAPPPPLPVPPPAPAAAATPAGVRPAASALPRYPKHAGKAVKQ